MKKWLAALLVLCMLFAAVPVTAYAAPPVNFQQFIQMPQLVAAPERNSGDYPLSYIENTPDAIRAALAKKQQSLFTPKRMLTAAALPSSYSGVENGTVTDIKNQSIYGLCWAFAATAAAESSLALAKNSMASLQTSVRGPGNCLVKWSSSDPAVATVVNGKVKAKSAGTAVITAYYLWGYATCVVHVTD